MQVQLRQKRSERRTRRHRHEGVRPAVAGAAPAEGQARLDESSAVARLKRPAHEALSGDAALYTCQCGFQFEATVSTSVGCPHCGGAQAW